ncbi:deubiquitinase OTUD6B-like [Thomomys bottae]
MELDEEVQLVRRHRKEKKELQAKIQGMKNAVPKNEKKRRKQLTEDVAKLEKEMEQKHREQLEQLKLASKENEIDTLDLKSKKEMGKNAAVEKEREERIAEAEIENFSGARHVENEKLTEILAARALEMRQIPSDGHCMYRAIEEQLKTQDCTLTVATLRSQTAEYMQSHFLTDPNTGDMYTPEELGKYCDEIVNTAAWGGQLELRALSHTLKTPIEIIQADSPLIVVGEEYAENPLILVYMRHAYGLGEHYNFVTTLVNTATENCI